MTFDKNVWDQLKGICTGDLIRALIRNGWELQDPSASSGALRTYRHPDGRIVIIHYHSDKKTYGRSLLRKLLEDIQWTVEDLKELKLIK